MHAMLDPIIRHSDEARRIYSSPTGARLVAGDTLRLPDLADTFEAIAQAGRGRALPRRAGARDGRDRARGRRRADAGRPRRLPRDLAAPAERALPASHGALEPAAVLRRRPDRLRARAARATARDDRRERRGRRGARRGDARAGPRPRRRLLRATSTAAGLRRGCSRRTRFARPHGADRRASGRRAREGGARRDDARLGDRRGGQRRGRLDLDRIRLRRHRARDRAST